MSQGGSHCENGRLSFIVGANVRNMSNGRTPVGGFKEVTGFMRPSFRKTNPKKLSGSHPGNAFWIRDDADKPSAPAGMSLYLMEPIADLGRSKCSETATHVPNHQTRNCLGSRRLSRSLCENLTTACAKPRNGKFEPTIIPHRTNRTGVERLVELRTLCESMLTSQVSAGPLSWALNGH